MSRVVEALKVQGRVARSLIRWGLLPYYALRRDQRPGVVVLLYHRVGGGAHSEIDMAVEVFERQMRYLRRHCLVVSLDEVVRMSTTQAGRRASRDVVAVTFDDGYAETFDLVYPILRRYNVPATVYVPAMYVEAQRPFDFGAYKKMDQARRPKPLTWDQAAEMTRSGLVTIGGHTYSHADLSRASFKEARRELQEADRLLEMRLGSRPRHFAYPWGRWSAETHALVATRYQTVSLGGPGKNPYADLDASRLWRYPVIRTDGFWLFRTRLHLLSARRALRPRPFNSGGPVEVASEGTTGGRLP
jgi:peptidoglycan/xylan/chitin deacetylase (PgdA/CDA1 family)